MEAIRVLVVDPHALFRAGVVGILQRQVDFEVVGEALDGIQAVQDARHLQPDIEKMPRDIREVCGTWCDSHFHSLLHGSPPR